MDDAWRQYFPDGSLAPRPDLHRHLAEWFAVALRRLEEPQLHSPGSWQPLTIRFLCLPTWSRTCSVRIEASGLTWRLTGKELDGEAGFELGPLYRQEDRLLSTAEAAQVEELWQYLRFWSIPRWHDDEVIDGTTYLLEAGDHDRYHVSHRDDPEWGDTFGEFSDLLVRLASFAPR